MQEGGAGLLPGVKREDSEGQGLGLQLSHADGMTQVSLLDRTQRRS